MYPDVYDSQKLKSAVKYGVGELIADEMEIRGWNAQDFATISGFSVDLITKMIRNEEPISQETAQILDKLFGGHPDFWLSKDAEYRQWKLFNA